MKIHHRITKKEAALEDTLNLSNSLNVRVISKNGRIIGKASQIRINPSKMSLEGILVSRGNFKKPIYIGISYVKRISHKSFILKMEPSILIKGRKVLDSKGKKVGNIKNIVRNGHSIEIREIVVTSPLRKDIILNRTKIKTIGESVILKSNYNVKKKYFWEKL